MKTLLFILLQAVLAFPGAEGYGRYTTGGRGGNVYYVTSLEDCTDANLVEGTLRWALRSGDDTPRTILFKVCGTIALQSKLKLEHPNVTIAGQTAPGGGICIAGANIYVCKPNVIIRHIRFRAGDMHKKNFPCLDIENTHHVILDHCSMTWSMEENLTAYDTDSTTVQWCIIGEGLYSSYHSKGTRAYATQWGGEHSSMYHTLITNCYSRTPRFNGVRDEADLAHGKHNHDAQVLSEFANNVVFNWGKANSAYGGECDTTKNRDLDGNLLGYNEVYMENNYYRAGPTTKACNLSKRYFVEASDKLPSGKWLLSGNIFELSNPYNATSRTLWQDTELAVVNGDNLAGYVTNSANRAFNIKNVTANQDSFEKYIVTSKRGSSGYVPEDAYSAYLKVCAGAGASLPRYDEEDTRLLAEAAGTVAPQFAGPTQPSWKGIIDGPRDITFSNGEDTYYVGDSIGRGYPYLDAQPGDGLVLDTDEDGLPDAYETANGLNPNDPSDGAVITPSGYSNLEVYLNGVADGQIDKTLYETETYISVEPKLPEGIWENESVMKSTKCIVNGRLLIRRGNRTYNALGF